MRSTLLTKVIRVKEPQELAQIQSDFVGGKLRCLASKQRSSGTG